jgi:hypothetical protein
MTRYNIAGYFFFNGEYGEEDTETIDLSGLTLKEVKEIERYHCHCKPKGFWLFTCPVEERPVSVDPEVIKYLKGKGCYVNS